MRDRLPRAIGRILEEGTLCHLAVRTAHGPHLTPVVHVLDGGRLWLTTSRTSVKARALRQDRRVAGLVRAGDAAVMLRGRARSYDALDPLSWPFAAVAGPRLVRAATRFSLKNARFFAGYAVDATRVPLAWTPPGRVFIGIELASGQVFDLAAGAVTDTWGQQGGDGRDSGYRRSFAALQPRHALDLRVPGSVRSEVSGSGEGALAWGLEEPSVVPVRWRRVAREGSYDVVVPRAFLELAGRPSPGGRARHRPGWAALTVDRLASWRASEMAGMLLQGPAEAFSLAAASRGGRSLRERIEAVLSASGPAGGTEDEPTGGVDALALIRIRPRRVVWWRGWSSGVVTARE